MPEVLIVLHPSIAPADRAVITRDAPPTQVMSDRVFLATVGDAAIARLRTLPGVAGVFTGGTDAGLPAMDDGERLFAQAWLSSRGRDKVRPGDGLDWDTPPMQPPDPKRPR